MFGMGGTEILVILIVALLFLGPDKLPDAAKKISKGIRDIKRQSRALQRTIEDDEHIGGAIRDLRSALRGEDEPIRPRPSPRQIEAAATPDSAEAVGAIAAAAAQAAGDTPAESHGEAHAPDGAAPAGDAPVHPHASGTYGADTGATYDPGALEGGHMAAHDAGNGAAEAPKLTLPPTAGESDAPAAAESTAEDLASLVKPAPNTIPRGGSIGPSGGPSGESSVEPSERKHG